MIDLVVTHLAAQLNAALRRTLQVSEDLVIASPAFEQDGTAATHAVNKLLVFLVNIERDTTAYSTTARAGSNATRIAVTTAPVHLNLMLMFAANFGAGNYQEALKLISSTAAYFQGRPLFDHHNSPDLDQRIERLVLEMESLSIGELSNLWGVLSGKYLPSILYRVRMVSVGANQLIAQRERIAQPQAGVRSKG
jgi:hypothetical protein